MAIEIRSDMICTVWQVLVADGQQVAAGETLLVLESMKMEIPIDATAAGTVEVCVAEGDTVDEGGLLARITPAG